MLHVIHQRAHPVHITSMINRHSMSADTYATSKAHTYIEIELHVIQRTLAYMESLVKDTSYDCCPIVLM